MTDENLLIDYTRFVDEVTSEESKDPEAFGDALDISMEDVIYTNIEKLESRYPDGFDSFRSENRNEGDI